MQASRSLKSVKRSLICVLLCAFILLNSVEGRYLPTRADESDVEVLKTIIKGLLTRPNEFDERPYSRHQVDRLLYQLAQQPSQQQQAISLQKRAAELPVMSSGESGIRAMESPLYKSLDK